MKTNPKRKRRRRTKLTMTKRVTTVLLIIGVIGGLLPYLLAMLDKQPVESMGIARVTEIVAVCLGYFVRGFKDSKESEDMAYKRAMAGLEMSALYEQPVPEADIPPEEQP